MRPELAEGVRLYTYSLNDGGDFYARNIRMGNGKILFDWVYPGGVVSDIDLGVPVRVNIENGVAAMALAWLNGAAPEEMRRAMKTFAGARRRFDFWIREGKTVLVDDYAHHPDEIKASISSLRALYAGKRFRSYSSPTYIVGHGIFAMNSLRHFHWPMNYFCSIYIRRGSSLYRELLPGLFSIR